jgi:phage tail P2-like protein
MSKTIYNVALSELLPENLRTDPDIVAASQAIDTEFQQLAGSIKNCITIADIDNASSKVVDHLAAEMNADFYDASYSLDKRRQFVKNAYLYKYRKGTAYAVKKLVEDAFENVSLIEWFEYNGDPYKFRIVFDGDLSGSEELNEVISAIKSVKNVRSKLESTTSNTKETASMYFGGCAVRCRYETVNQFISEKSNALTITGVYGRI